MVDGGTGSNFLDVSWGLVAALLATLLVFGVLVVWPLVGSVGRRQWGYLLGIVLLGPLGGLVWLLIGRQELEPEATQA